MRLSVLVSTAVLAAFTITAASAQTRVDRTFRDVEWSKEILREYPGIGAACQSVEHPGDPDMEPDELRAAIEKAEAKRRELMDLSSGTKDSAKVMSMLPKAAELYRKQISDGLDGDLDAATRARTILRDMLGEIRLQPAEDGGLWAEYGMHPAILLKGAGALPEMVGVRGFALFLQFQSAFA